MAYTSIYLPEFDRDADFEVCIPFTVSGKDQKRGDAFDKTLCSTRTLRSLYENRWIKAVAKAARPPPEIRHIGRGRYAVFVENVRLTPEPLSREAANEEAKRVSSAA